jgi:hypothetical protein
MRKYNFSGNSYDRRKLRRYLNRVALPLVDANVPLAVIAKRVNVPYSRLMQHLHNEGYTQAGWMYRKPSKPSEELAA